MTPPKMASLLVAGMVTAMSHAALATPIVYTESDFLRVTIGASGQLVGTLTLTETADTSTVVTLAPGVVANPGTVTFSFTTLSLSTFTGMFTDSMAVVDNQNNGTAGFTDSTLPADVLNTLGSEFDSYDLTSLIGPVTGPAEPTFGEAFATTAGSLTLLSSPRDINRSTFTVSGVPEPAASALMIVGLLGLGQVRRRRTV